MPSPIGGGSAAISRRTTTAAYGSIATGTLALDNPANDTATSGNRAPYLETYLTRNTVRLRIGSPTFTVPTVRG